MPPLALLAPTPMVDRTQGRDAHTARLPLASMILLIVKAIQLGGG